MKARTAFPFALLLAALLSPCPSLGQLTWEIRPGQEPDVAAPIDPVTAIIDAYDSYAIVALAEGAHGNVPAHQFRLSLIRDPRFSAAVDDIVVEWGNGQYQDVLDRFTNGEAVDYDELQRVWQTSGAPSTWGVPIFEAFFREIRELNAAAPEGRKIRVILGDLQVPLDDGRTLSKRGGSYTASLIYRDVIAKGRKALVVYGGLHFLRKNLYWPSSDLEWAEERYKAPVSTIVAHLESDGIGVFSIYTTPVEPLVRVQPDAATWETPSLVLVAGTAFGVTPFADIYRGDSIRALSSGLFERARPERTRSGMMQEQYDAILNLGSQTQF